MPEGDKIDVGSTVEFDAQTLRGLVTLTGVVKEIVQLLPDYQNFNPDRLVKIEAGDGSIFQLKEARVRPVAHSA